MPQAENKSRHLAVVAMVLGYLIPGAGHVLLRRPVRGLVIFVVITATFWAGIGIGGVMTVDRYKERWWFCAQVLSGAQGLVGWQLNERAYTRTFAKLETDPAYQAIIAQGRLTESQANELRLAYMERVLAEEDLALVAPTDTAARAYSGVAGMLNLMCMFDALTLALMGVSGEPTEDGKKRQAGSEQS